MRTPHSRAVVQDAAARGVPGHGGVDWTQRCGCGGALRRCGDTREQGRQAQAVRLVRCGQEECNDGRAVRTPHRRAMMPVAAVRRVSGQGDVDKTQRCGGGGEQQRCGATRGARSAAPAMGLGQG